MIKFEKKDFITNTPFHVREDREGRFFCPHVRRLSTRQGKGKSPYGEYA
jgi:hypothetical protein